jgi:hypothetical protein
MKSWQVEKILADADRWRLNQPAADDTDEMIAAHAPDASTCEGWEAINAIETAADQAASPGRPRVKLTSGKPRGSD